GPLCLYRLQGRDVVVERGRAGDQQVIATATNQDVRTGPADQHVAVGAADQHVVAVTTDQHVGTIAPLEEVVARATDLDGRQLYAAGDPDGIVARLTVGDNPVDPGERPAVAAFEQHLDGVLVGTCANEDDGIVAQGAADHQGVPLKLDRLDGDGL